FFMSYPFALCHGPPSIAQTPAGTSSNLQSQQLKHGTRFHVRRRSSAATGSPAPVTHAMEEFDTLVVLQSKESQEETAEHHLHAKREEGDGGNDLPQRARIFHGAKPRFLPSEQAGDQEADAH